MDKTLERILSLLPTKPDGSLKHGAKTELARSIGAPSNIFAEWTAGRNSSYKNYLYQIAEHYNVSVEWLKGESDKKEKSPTPEGVGLSLSDMKKMLHDMDLKDLTEMMAECASVIQEKTSK